MKRIYYIILTFVSINLLSQNKIYTKEQCKLKHDSIFKNYFGEFFFKKNIKYNKEESYIDLYLTNDMKNDDDYKRIFLNINNDNDIKRYKKEYPKFYSSDYYKYEFYYKGKVFYERIYTCELVNDKELSDLINREIFDYYNKIKNKVYLSPKKATRIAKVNGLKNICYQSLTSASFHNKNRDVWQIQDCSNEITGKIIELDPKTGKVLTLFERDYGKNGQAAYWLFFNKNK